MVISLLSWADIAVYASIFLGFVYVTCEELKMEQRRRKRGAVNEGHLSECKRDLGIGSAE
jgi:hypothetical protein